MVDLSHVGNFGKPVKDCQEHAEELKRSEDVVRRTNSERTIGNSYRFVASESAVINGCYGDSRSSGKGSCRIM